MEQNPETNPMMMPGPQFNQVEMAKSWPRRHGQKIILGLIAALLLTGGISLYKNYQQRKTLLQPALQEILESPAATVSPLTSPSPSGAPGLGAKDFETPTAQPTPSPTVAMKKIKTAVEVRRQNTDLIAKANQGHGATHLARQALKEYLKDKDDLAKQLKAEHKIYIEDYLQKHVKHPKMLQVGDELSFSQTLIQEAINKAQTLNDKQIKNLGKYVPLVPSL